MFQCVRKNVSRIFNFGWHQNRRGGVSPFGGELQLHPCLEKWVIFSKFFTFLTEFFSFDPKTSSYRTCERRRWDFNACDLCFWRRLFLHIICINHIMRLSVETSTSMVVVAVCRDQGNAEPLSVRKNDLNVCQCRIYALLLLNVFMLISNSLDVFQ